MACSTRQASLRHLHASGEERFLVLWDPRIDPAAAEHEVALIEDGGLTRGDGALGLVEADFHSVTIVAERRDGSGSGLMAVTDFDFGAGGRGESGPRDPIDIARYECGAQQMIVRTDSYALGYRVGRDDIQRLTLGDAETFALADGEVMERPRVR